MFQKEDLTFTVKEALGSACSAILYMKYSAGPMLQSFLDKVPSDVEERNFLFLPSDINFVFHIEFSWTIFVCGLT